MEHEVGRGEGLAQGCTVELGDQYRLWPADPGKSPRKWVSGNCGKLLSLAQLPLIKWRL